MFLFALFLLLLFFLLDWDLFGWLLVRASCRANAVCVALCDGTSELVLISLDCLDSTVLLQTLRQQIPIDAPLFELLVVMILVPVLVYRRSR